MNQSQETKVALLEQSIQHINQSLSRIESSFDRLESKFTKLETEVSANFKWMVGIFVTIGLSLAAWIHIH